MRDYGHAEQLGLEHDLGDYVDRLATILDEARRVLVPTGTAWVNLGDSYVRPSNATSEWPQDGHVSRRVATSLGRTGDGMKPGDLAGAPWLVALECRRRGWYLRSEVIWHKPNAMPESTATRPGRAHEHLFLLTRAPSPGYHYDADAIRTPLRPSTLRTWGTERVDHGGGDLVRSSKFARTSMRKRAPKVLADGSLQGAHRGSVWSVAVGDSRERVQHFAMQALEVVRLCIVAGCPEGGIVLDPFAGAGTTGIVAHRLGRRFLGVELVPAYAELARERIAADAPLLARARP
jgi:DNA modification methylase